jgi:HK97 family phage portal protein
MANPITRTIKSIRKSLTIAFYAGRVLAGRGWAGAGNRFFSELTYGDSDAGIAITGERALNYTAYWSCVSLMAQTLASLSCFVYRRKGERGRSRATDHPLYLLLHSEPNPEMDSFSYFESLMYHLVANNGNAYSYIDWDADLLTIKALWPMNPDRVTKLRNEKLEIEYEYRTENGPVRLPAFRVWHIPGFGFDGLIGYTPLTYARNQIGLGIAAERMGSNLFKNGLTVGGMAMHPGQMSKEAQQRFRESIEEQHKGVDKAHRLLILEEGMKYEKNSIPPNDAQMLETRKYQRNEMAAFFHIPPHLVGDLEHATFSNIEEQSLEFVQYTMRPWLVRWERSINRQLLLPQEKEEYYTEFLVDSLLRGNIESRYRAYAIGRNWGWLTPNRIAEIENLEPIPPEDGGDTFLQPMNMAPADEFNAGILGPGGIPKLMAISPYSKKDTLKRPKQEIKNMTPEQWQEAYENGDAHWAEDLTPSIFAQEFLEKLKISKSRTVLEIGCGNGRDSIFFARAGLITTGIDVAPAAIEIAKNNAENASVEVEFLEANAEELPFQDRQFDSLFSLSVLHASDLNKSIPEAGRVTAKNSPGFIHIYADTQYADGSIEVHIYLDDYISLLNQAGFDIIDIYSEEEAEYDEYGEKHKIIVANLRKS